MNKQLLLAGVIFTFHNIEEAIGFTHFVFPPPLIHIIPQPSTGDMIIAILFVTLLAWGIIGWGIKNQNVKIKRNILAGLVFIFLVNALVPHIIGAIILHTYTPGLCTSISLYVPYSFWVLLKKRLYFST